MPKVIPDPEALQLWMDIKVLVSEAKPKQAAIYHRLDRLEKLANEMCSRVDAA